MNFDFIDVRIIVVVIMYNRFVIDLVVNGGFVRFGFVRRHFDVIVSFNVIMIRPFVLVIVKLNLFNGYYDDLPSFHDLPIQNPMINYQFHFQH